MPHQELVNVHDYHIRAQKTLARMTYDYYSSGAEDEITLKRTRKAFDAIKLVPRVLRGSGVCDTTTTIMGHLLSSPLLVAPTAMQKMAHPDGELATARAAAKAKTIMTLSSLSTSTTDAVAHANGNGVRWFQLYVLKRRELTEKLVRRVEQEGYSALCLTVDTPYLGRRENDLRNEFHLPQGLTLEVFKEVLGSNLPKGLNQFVADQLDSSLDWASLAWLKGITRLPILVKGVLSPQDAMLAIENGASGIIVSNHGARQLDTVPATIEMLPHIAKAVGGRVPVFLDGGVQRGTDILKAVALGATAVFIGRPILWGLAVDGENGVTEVLNIILEEFKIAMSLCGCSKIADITPELILHSQSKL